VALFQVALDGVMAEKVDRFKKRCQESDPVTGQPRYGENMKKKVLYCTETTLVQGGRKRGGNGRGLLVVVVVVVVLVFSPPLPMVTNGLMPFSLQEGKTTTIS